MGIISDNDSVVVCSNPPPPAPPPLMRVKVAVTAKLRGVYFPALHYAVHW